MISKSSGTSPEIMCVSSMGELPSLRRSCRPRVIGALCIESTISKPSLLDHRRFRSVSIAEGTTLSRWVPGHAKIYLSEKVTTEPSARSSVSNQKGRFSSAACSGISTHVPRFAFNKSDSRTWRQRLHSPLRTLLSTGMPERTIILRSCPHHHLQSSPDNSTWLRPTAAASPPYPRVVSPSGIQHIRKVHPIHAAASPTPQ